MFGGSIRWQKQIPMYVGIGWAEIEACHENSCDQRKLIGLSGAHHHHSYQHRNSMKLPLTTVEDAGLVIRALRKHGGVRIDDFAVTAKVSKQLMTDLENGKPTVQMGRVLRLLQGLGVHVTLEIPDAVGPTLALEQAKQRRRKVAKPTASGSASSDA
jgi:DNA-binding transcriptional regulator YiaG